MLGRYGSGRQILGSHRVTVLKDRVALMRCAEFRWLFVSGSEYRDTLTLDDDKMVGHVPVAQLVWD